MDTTDDNVYDALAAADHDGRWAHGTGFDESVVEVTAPAPDGIDRDDLAAYCLMLADDALIASQRLSEWATNAPELEEEVALANIALDLLGQARVLLARAGHLGATDRFRVAGGASGAKGNGRAHDDEDAQRSGAGPDDEDVLAYFRDDRFFRNVMLAEIDLGDFAQTMAWMLVFSSWRLALMTRLRGSADPVLAAVAGKAVPELAYQREYAAGWVVRLGDGTELSHARMQAGLEAVWPFLEEIFSAHVVETRLVEANVAVDPASLRAAVDADIDQVLPVATLTKPDRPAVGLVGGRGGRDGVHTEALGPVLAVMQSLARAHPGATW